MNKIRSAFLRTKPVLRASHRNKFVISFENKESQFGLGVFTCQKVFKGDAVWWYDEQKCERLNKDNIKQVSEERLANVLWKGYLNQAMNKFIVLEDGAQYTNHGNPANIKKFGYNSDCDWLRPYCE